MLHMYEKEKCRFARTRTFCLDATDATNDSRTSTDDASDESSLSNDDEQTTNEHANYAKTIYECSKTRWKD